MRLKLISCEVLYREVCWAVARSPNIVDVTFLPKGLHDIGATKMRARIQATLDAVDAALYEAVLFGYGLCNNGLAGLVAPQIPLVLPRAHDCITLFLGSRQRYLDYFHTHPGVYFKTTGWIERGENTEELRQLSLQRQIGLARQLEDFIARYGEDNGRYLYSALGQEAPHYRQFTFIEMGVEPDDRYEQQVRAEAAQRGWQFEKVQGDLRLLQRLIDGVWDETDFLVVPPGYRVVARYDEGVIAAEP